MRNIIRRVIKRKRASSIYKTKTLSLFFALAIVSASAYLFVPAGETSALDITAEKIIELTNQSRMEVGRGILIENEKLSLAAESKVKDMIANNYFSHTSPSGITPWKWIENQNYDYNYAGENLAMDFHSTEKMQKAWMASPTHRANILNEKYHEIGTAVKIGKLSGHETTVVAVMFGSGDKNGSSTDKGEKEISKSEEEKEPEKYFPSLPAGEERKAIAAVDQPMITSPRSGEIISESEVKIFGRSKAGETVAIFDNGNFVGSTSADLKGWFSLSESGLADGIHNLAVQNKKMFLEAETEFYVDQKKPNINFRLYADEKDSRRFILEAGADKNNCIFQFNGEARYAEKKDRLFFSIDAGKSSVVLRVRDQAGNKNFKQINLANYYSGNGKKIISDKVAELMIAPKNIFAANSGREALKNKLNIAMGGFVNY